MTNFIHTEMFGANLLTHANGNYGQISGEYVQAYERLGSDGIRFPGGTVTETAFLPSSPNKAGETVNQATFVGLDATLEFAKQSGAEVTLVVPTTSEGAIAFVHETLRNHPLANVIGKIEVGNEFWGVGQTASEYGEIANQMINEFSQYEREILVQMGNPWGNQYAEGGIYSDLSWSQKTQQVNLDIIEQLDPNNLARIDGLVQHYYERGNDVGLTHIKNSVRIWEETAGVEADLAITEWNIHSQNQTDTGLRGAGTFLETFVNLVELGVDIAHVWPPHLPTPSNLWETRHGEGALTPSGAVLAELANLDGFWQTETDLQFKDTYIAAFTDGAQTHIFVVSQSTENMSVSAANLNVVNAEIIGFDPATVDGFHFQDELVPVPVYQDHDALALITLVDEDTYELAPFEVLHLQTEELVIASETSSMMWEE